MARGVHYDLLFQDKTMSANPPRKKISSYTYQMGMGALRFRLEFDQEVDMQSVFMENLLVSSIACPPGKRAVHSFTQTTSTKPGYSSTSYYRVHFAVEKSTCNIRFKFLHRFENTGWIAVDSNVDKERLASIPLFEPKQQ
jgi:hypothetical protein